VSVLLIESDDAVLQGEGGEGSNEEDVDGEGLPLWALVRETSVETAVDARRAPIEGDT
jgi:hypothetical protein